MKKIFFYITAVVTVLLAGTSCSLNTKPYGSAEQKPFESVEDARIFRESLYALLRSAESVNTFSFVDYMSDLYDVCKGDGNTTSPFCKWDRPNLESNDMVAGYYFSFYNLIMQCHYFNEHVAAYLETKQGKALTEEDKATLAIYMAEAKTMIANSYYRLMVRFSNRYNNDNDGADLGVVLLKKYDFMDRSARSTQKEVYTYALDLLDKAYNTLPMSYQGTKNESGKPLYIIKDYVAAVKARIYLEMHDYDNAIAEVDKFIDKYPLTEKDEFEEAWRKETTSEIMVALYASDKIGITTSSLLYPVWLAKNPSRKNPIWAYASQAVPSQNLIDLYTASDIRRSVYLGSGIVFAGSENFAGVVFNKFFGNPKYYRDEKTKPAVFGTYLFRIPEAYLIKAEALAYQHNPVALEVLNVLREARGATSLETSADAIKAVQTERTIELIGEGTRMNDLKRWGMGVDRTEIKHQEKAANFVYDTKIVKDAKDPMMIFEFPLRDRQANPNLVKNW